MTAARAVGQIAVRLSSRRGSQLHGMAQPYH